MDFAFKTCVILSALMLSCCIGQTPVESQVPFTIEIIPGAANQQFKLKLNRVLRCTASATDDNQKPTLYWEINGVRITSRTDRVRVEPTSDNNSLMLRIDNIQYGDEGIYKCVAILGSQSESRSVRVKVIQDLVVLSSANQFGIFGKDGEVKCEAESRPPPLLIWKDENGINIENSTKRVILSDRLLIKNLDDDDSKTYICDIYVIETGESRAFPITFQVVHPPKIEMIPTISPSNPKEGDPEVKITCNSTGFPQPTFTFKKGDNLLPEDQVDVVNGILSLHNLTQEDEANYTCVATNIGGSDQKSIWLDVTSQNVGSSEVPFAIQIIPSATNQQFRARMNHFLACTASVTAANQKPTLYWEINGVRITSRTDRVRVRLLGDKILMLRIDNVQVSDEGIYSCVATLGSHITSKSVNVQVYRAG